MMGAKKGQGYYQNITYCFEETHKDQYEAKEVAKGTIIINDI